MVAERQYFRRDVDVVRVDIGDEKWVAIKQKMSYGDHQRLAAYYMKVQAKLQQLRTGSIEDANVELDLEQGDKMLLFINVKDWNLPHPDKPGEVMPVTYDTVNELDPDIAAIVLQQIGERNPPVEFPKVASS